MHHLYLNLKLFIITPVQNYNGLTGIGDTFSNDSTFLYDNEYKYEDAPSNSVSRGTARFRRPKLLIL